MINYERLYVLIAHNVDCHIITNGNKALRKDGYV